MSAFTSQCRLPRVRDRRRTVPHSPCLPWRPILSVQPAKQKIPSYRQRPSLHLLHQATRGRFRRCHGCRTCLQGSCQRGRSMGNHRHTAAGQERTFHAPSALAEGYHRRGLPSHTPPPGSSQAERRATALGDLSSTSIRRWLEAGIAHTPYTIPSSHDDSRLHGQDHRERIKASCCPEPVGAQARASRGELGRALTPPYAGQPERPMLT